MNKRAALASSQLNPMVGFYGRCRSLLHRRSIIAAAVASIGLSPAYAANVSWTDGTGFWDVAGNWSSSPALPGSGDDVSINVLVGTQTITIRSPNNFTVNSLAILGDEILALTGGSLTVSNGYTSSGSTVL
jgi:hypothetical protein